MTASRVGIVLPSTHDTWYREQLCSRLLLLASRLVREGWHPQVIEVVRGVDRARRRAVESIPGVHYRPIGADEDALFVGPGPGSMTQAMRDGYRVAMALRNDPPDVLLVPLREGQAQPLLMARATGEAFGEAAFLLLADTTTRWRILNSDEAVSDPGVLIADALERTSLGLADAVAVSSPESLAAIRDISGLDLACHGLSLPWVHCRPSSTSVPGPVREIVFASCPGHHRGLPIFLDAVEKLSRRGVLKDQCVTFLRPLRNHAPGMSKSLIGVRSTGWPFRFRSLEMESPTAAFEYLSGAGRLPVFAAGNLDDDGLVAALVSSGKRVLLTSDHPKATAPALLSMVCRADATSLAGELASRLDGMDAGGPPAMVESEPSDWSSPIKDLIRGRQASSSRELPALPSLTVCINHYNRPAQLEVALASVERGGLANLEVLIFDNGSTSDEACDKLADIERRMRSRLRIVRAGEGIPLPAARNRVAVEASGDVILFLDDDNAVARGGLARFVRAFVSGRFDIVVTCLDMYDGPLTEVPPADRQLFLGDAGAAGLMFNCFGDSNMAVCRKRFLEIGGFDEASGAADDWIFLAKARAAGLRIGVLQEPAICYARDDSGAPNKWRKRDLEGARAAVLRAFGNRFDAALVARLAQGLVLPLF